MKPCCRAISHDKIPRVSTPDRGAIDVGEIRRAFPAMTRTVHDKPLVYLDSASTTQKPRAVIDAVVRAMEATANIHRGVHALSVEATAAYEAVRGKAAKLLHAGDPREIVFVRGTTEALNLVAQSYGRAHVGLGDEVVVTALEHHANIVPWQLLCAEKGAHLRVIPIDDRGDVAVDAAAAIIGEKTKIVAIAHVSNTLGTVLPIGAISMIAKRAGAIVVVDGAQAVAHTPVDVRAIGCDFYAFSGHKLYGPTGAGVLWGRREILDAMPPWQGGGDMITSVRFEGSTYREAPHRFEAGTPDITSVIGLGAAIEWVLGIGVERLAAREHALLGYLVRALATVRDLRFVGEPRERASVVSFNVGTIHPHDLGTALDLDGIAVRTGKHCTEPLLDRLGVDATVRASIGAYTNEAEVDTLVHALDRAREVLA